MLPNGAITARADQPTALPTKFAPAERYELPIVERQARRFLEISPLMHDVLDALPEMLVALNSARQIVFANRAWQIFVRSLDMTLPGLRPGEVLDCIHAGREPGGCGTSEFCQVCGAARAVLASQSGQVSMQECRITQTGGEALDLRVLASPLCAGENRFTLFSIVDISHEKRRRTLERVFFHDILNTLTALRASTYMFGRTEPEEQLELSQMITRLVERMVDEITWQRQLTDAENDELAVLPGQIDVSSLLQGVADSARQCEFAREITIRLDLSETAVSLHSDRTLLRRVLNNMLKNALEASRPGNTVTFGCASKGQGLEFWVHNPTCMPREVQLQVFQRSFSTKGSGRGLGTYSIRLLTERYLQGHACFTSTPADGTVFRAWYPLHLAPAGT